LSDMGQAPDHCHLGQWLLEIWALWSFLLQRIQSDEWFEPS
jgi:hypothetical protein